MIGNFRLLTFMTYKMKNPSLAAAVTPELEFAHAVRRSASGQLSVSIDDLSKTKTFSRDLKVLSRIAELQRAKTRTSSR